MNRFEKIKLKDIDELVEWIDENETSDCPAWLRWWDDNYCLKCQSEIAYVEAFGRECECAWCELNCNCRFFPKLDDVPDNKQIIKMWLEQEI